MVAWAEQPDKRAGTQMQRMYQGEGQSERPLMPTKLPDRPWQKLGADLFMLKDKTYLLVVDYFSRYVEIAQLSPTKSMNIIVHLKSMFAP